MEPNTKKIILAISIALCVSLPLLRAGDLPANSDQSIVDAAFHVALGATGTKSGTIIVMNAASGEITGLADPAFALGHTFEPGGLLRPLTIALAIDAGLVAPDTVIDCHHGMFREGSVSIPDRQPWDQLTVGEILAKSSNIGTYQIGKRLGMERFHSGLERFGLGHATGTPLPGETSGRLPNTTHPVDFSRRTYGYCLATTAIRIATIYAAFANGGKSIKPWTKEELHADSSVPEQILKPETARIIRTLLENACRPGTIGSRAAVEGISIGGSGATLHTPTRPQHTTVSFAGYFDLHGVTHVAVIVIDDLADRPDGVNGSPMAASVFADLVRHLSRKNVSR
ncbi:MAG: hypothetical protein KDN05_04680 [Verrucomicrobiae bacterium]|nr:hypothetical protein [Verrucomicrobiae bacterium]